MKLVGKALISNNGALPEKQYQNSNRVVSAFYRTAARLHEKVLVHGTLQSRCNDAIVSLLMCQMEIILSEDLLEH